MGNLVCLDLYLEVITVDFIVKPNPSGYIASQDSAESLLTVYILSDIVQEPFLEETCL